MRENSIHRAKSTKNWIVASAVLIATVIGTNVARAERITVSVADLDEALYELEFEPDAISKLALQKVQSEIDAAGLTLEAGEVLFNDFKSDLVIEDGCNATEIRTLDTTISLESDSNLSLSIASLYEPIEVSVALDAQIVVSGRAKQTVGFRLGSCQDLANDNFSFTADGLAKLNLSLSLQLNPVLDRDGRALTLRPALTLNGNLTKQGITVDVNDSLLSSILEGYIEDEIDDALSDTQVVSAINDLEQELSDALAEELDNGELILELPSPSDEQVNTLYSLLSPSADFSLSLGYMRTHRVALLAALIVGDTAGVEAVISDAVQCEVAGILQTSLTHEPVYRLSDQGCQVSQISANGLDSNTQSWFVDEQCQLPLDYFETTTVDYCTQVLNTERLGYRPLWVNAHLK